MPNAAKPSPGPPKNGHRKNVLMVDFDGHSGGSLYFLERRTCTSHASMLLTPLYASERTPTPPIPFNTISSTLHVYMSSLKVLFMHRQNVSSIGVMARPNCAAHWSGCTRSSWCLGDQSLARALMPLPRVHWRFVLPAYPSTSPHQPLFPKAQLHDVELFSLITTTIATSPEVILK